MIFGKKVKVVLDMDEILTNISPLWTALIHKNGEYFSKYLNLIEDFSYNKNYNDVLLRDEFDLLKWLKNKDIELDYETEQELKEKFFSLYNNDSFYNLCKPTKLCKFFIDYSNYRYFEKIYIISRTTPETLEGKKKFIEKYFKDNPKIEFIPVKLNEKKSDVFKRIGHVDIYFEDELKNIKDIIENIDDEMDIYIPKFGYNIPDQEFLEEASNRNKIIMSYDVIGGNQKWG